MDKEYQKQRIEKSQKFLLKLLHLHIGNYYPLRKYLGINYEGKVDEITNLSIAYDTKDLGDERIQQTRTYQSPDLGYKLNLLLDKIPQLALLPALLQPAYGLAALAFFFLTQTTYQPSDKDSFMDQNSPGAWSGSYNYLKLQGVTNYIFRSILEFIISDIPEGADISAANLQLYYYNYVSTNPNRIVVWAYKVTRTNWSEAHVGWTSYKTGSNWTTAGGDYVTSDPSGGSTAFASGYGWLSWNVLAICQDADGSSLPLEVLIKFENEAQGTASLVSFYSSRYTGDTSNRPKLTVTYTVAAGPANLKSYNGLAIASMKSIMGLGIADIKSINGLA